MSYVQRSSLTLDRVSSRDILLDSHRNRPVRRHDILLWNYSLPHRKPVPEPALRAVSRLQNHMLL